MVEHLVLFKLTADATEEQRARMISELKALRDKIPGIVDRRSDATSATGTRASTSA